MSTKKNLTNEQILESLENTHRIICNTDQIFEELARIRSNAMSMNPNLTLRENYELSAKAMIANYTRFLNAVVECNS